MNNTLVKGLQLLEVLARSETPLGVSELAEQLTLGKSNVHRLLQALVELGYVQKNEHRSTYQASLRLWEIGTAMASRLSIKTHALGGMQQLQLSTRETVHLCVLDGDEVVYAHKIDSPQPVRAYSEIGGRSPAWCVAPGKAILAWQAEAYLTALAQRLLRFTPRTITEPAEFVRELERVRSSGYAVNRGEYREEVWGIAAPIRNAGGAVIASIGGSGPATRMKAALTKKDVIAEVMAAAHSVTQQLAVG